MENDVLKLDQVKWSSPVKIKSRQETIIDLYHKLFGRTKLPLGKTYWSMAGQCLSGGKLVSGSEYDQLIESGFLLPCQFHGVEINKDIHNQNMHLGGGNWHLGKLDNVVEDHILSNPGIVRHDDTMMPKTCIRDFVNLVYALTVHGVTDIMVLFTAAISARGYKVGVDCISYELSSSPRFMISMDEGWRCHDQVYLYTSNIAGTTMATVGFWR